MNLFAVLLGYSLRLLPSIVLGIQSVEGDRTAGATKKQMATDALNAAVQGAAAVLPAGSNNAALAQGAGAAAGAIIDATGVVTSVLNHLQKTDAVTAAVNVTKATGAYQAATVQATAAQKPQATPAEDEKPAGA